MDPQEAADDLSETMGEKDEHVSSRTDRQGLVPEGGSGNRATQKVLLANGWIILGVHRST